MGHRCDEGGEPPCFAHLIEEPPPERAGTGPGGPMPGLEIWFNPECSKCRTAQGLLAEREIAAEYLDYLRHPPTVVQLRRLLELLGTTSARTIARTGEPLWGDLGLDSASDDDVLRAMTANPILIERPIAILGGRAVIARPPERVLELLDDGQEPSG